MTNAALTVSRLDATKRHAILLIGEEEDTAEGFGIEPHILEELRKQELVNVDDTVRFKRYMLNRNGLACWAIIVSANRNLLNGIHDL
jgi:hypothetical protein